jgi:hypothetical protein
VAELSVASVDKSETDVDVSAQLQSLKERFDAQSQLLDHFQAERAEFMQMMKAFQEQNVQLEEKQLAQEQQIASIVDRTVTPPCGDVASQTAKGLTDLKEEVTTIATALSILCNRVNAFAAEDTQSALQTEIGAIANVVSNLTMRVDQLAGQDALLAATPTLSREVTLGGENETLETAQDLRERLAALVGDVRRVQDEQRLIASPAATPSQGHRVTEEGNILISSSSQACVSSAQPLRQDSSLGNVINFLEHRADATRGHLQLVPAATPIAGQRRLQDLQDARVMSPQMQLPLATTVTVTKAPSPRHWLGEPLSVAVGRNDSQQQATMAHQAAERILRGSRC